VTTTRQQESITAPVPPRRGWVRALGKWVGIVLAAAMVAVTAWWFLARNNMAPNPTITVAAQPAAAAPMPTFTGPAADGCTDIRLA
jgi:hypothetical protein